MNSKIFSWPNAADLVKGAVIAGLSAVFTGLYDVLTSASPHFPTGWLQWQPICIAGASGFVGYLVKNYFSNSAGELAKPDTTPAAQAIIAVKEAK